MTPEEKFNQEIWWILQEIRKEQLSTPKGEKVEFSLRKPPKYSRKTDDSLPSDEAQRKLLHKLKEWKALDLKPTGFFMDDNIFAPPTAYLLTIRQLKFDELYRLYESGNSYSESKNASPETKTSQSIIKPKSLELIAREIGNLETGTNLIDFLTDCGVDKNLIEYPQTKWRMVYDVFITLAASPNPKNQEILFKIIEEASHPLMHNGDEEIAKTYEDKFNKLLKYDGFTLKNYKVKKINREVRQDDDLDLYLKKKILVENWRDDLPHPITELSFNNNTIEQICYSLWDLFVADIISFGANTTPEDILIETDPRFHQEIAFNWNLIGDLDNNPHKVEADDGFDIEILDEKRLKKDVDEEISEFIANKVNAEKIEAVKEFYPDTKHLETPSYLRGISRNYYAYKKQKEILLNHIASLYNQFENEILVIKFNEIEDPNINVLRTMLALEKEGLFAIKELSNDKQEWTDKDNVFIKAKLAKSKILALKKLATNSKRKAEDKPDGELLNNKQAKSPIPIAIIEMPELKIKKESRIKQRPPRKDNLLLTKELKADIVIGKLSAYNDGTIRYGKNILEMRNQLKDLCRLFMRNQNRLLTIDDIKDEIIKADRRTLTSFATIAKYVSELHNLLKIHFGEDVIFNQKEEGWYFKPTE